MRTFRVNEIFLSLQGEGANAGKAAVFIRLSGCNLRCPFCDTDFKEHIVMDVPTIINHVRESCNGYTMPRWCVITGGEPSLQPIQALVEPLHELGMKVAVETNGTREIPSEIDFVTVSPKFPFVEKEQHADVVLKRANEVKVVMTEGISVETIRGYEAIKAGHYFIQPCDTGDAAKNKAIMQRAVEFIKYHPNWQLSLQQQKILNVR